MEPSAVPSTHSVLGAPLLSLRPPEERLVSLASRALSTYKSHRSFPHYIQALRTAIMEEPPPCTTDLYQEMFEAASSGGQWVALSMIGHAERSGIDARRYWSLAASCVDRGRRLVLKGCAITSARHALHSLELLDVTFPGALDRSFRLALNELSPRFSSRHLLPASPVLVSIPIDVIVQANFSELRRAFLRLLQGRAVAAHCPQDNLPQATGLIDKMLQDSMACVAHTAEAIERAVKYARPGDFRDDFEKEMRKFNRLVSEESIDYSYNRRFGLYP
jgi:hypothetical protein